MADYAWLGHKPDWITDDIPGDFRRLTPEGKRAALRWLQAVGYDDAKVAATVGLSVEAVDKLLEETG